MGDSAGVAIDGSRSHAAATAGRVDGRIRQLSGHKSKLYGHRPATKQRMSRAWAPAVRTVRRQAAEVETAGTFGDSAASPPCDETFVGSVTGQGESAGPEEVV